MPYRRDPSTAASRQGRRSRRGDARENGFALYPELEDGHADEQAKLQPVRARIVAKTGAHGILPRSQRIELQPHNKAILVGAIADHPLERGRQFARQGRNGDDVVGRGALRMLVALTVSASPDCDIHAINVLD